MTPTTPSPISDQAAGEPIAWPKLTDEMARAFYSAYNIAHEHRGAFESVLAGYNAMQRVSTAPTTGSAPVAALRCSCENIAEPRDSHVDALRCKSCWDRFAATASPAASVPISPEVVRALSACISELKAWMREHGQDLRTMVAIDGAKALLAASMVENRK